MMPHLTTEAAIGAALMSGKLTRIMCADLMVGDVVQDEQTGEMFAVIMRSAKSYTLDGDGFGEASYGEPLPVKFSIRPNQFVMGIRAEDIVTGV